MIKKLQYKNFLFGYIIRYRKKNGVNFLTPPNLTHQIGSIRHKKNHKILPHLHLPNKRKIDYTSEVLVIQKGKLRIDLYSNKKKYLFSKILMKDDILILTKGAHGFKILEPTDILEIKQGPYNHKKDKIRFQPIDAKKIKLK